MPVVPLFRARVLVISSGHPFLHLIQALDGQGFSVSTSQGWETALAKIGRLQPDLVISSTWPLVTSHPAGQSSRSWRRCQPGGLCLSWSARWPAGLLAGGEASLARLEQLAT